MLVNIELREPFPKEMENKKEKHKETLNALKKVPICFPKGWFHFFL